MRPSTGATSRPTIVFFAANPTLLDELDLDGEIRSIEAELANVGLGDVLRFSFRPATTPDGLQRALLDERPTVVQFSGHGRGGPGASDGSRGAGTTRELTDDEPGDDQPTTGIMLQGDQVGEIKVVSGATLGALFSIAELPIRLVFLNACHSAEQATALLRHVDFVVGLDGAIRDSAAKVFAVAFYRALAHGRTIQTAFDMAVNALVLHGLGADAKLPILRSREGANPKQTTLAAAPKTDDDPAWDVYITYAEIDRDAARELAIALHERKLKVFFDEWTIAYGTVASRRMEAGIRNSFNGIVAISSNTIMEDWVEQQYSALLDEAVREKKRLIPVLVGSGKVDLPPFLRIRRGVDLRDKTEQEQRRVVDTIAGALRGQPPGPPPRHS